MRYTLISLVLIMVITLTGCKSYINTKDDTILKEDEIKNLNEIESEKSTSEGVKSLDEITGIESKEQEDGADELLIEEVQQLKKVEMPDGSELELSIEAAEAVLKYKELNKQVLDKHYPQKRVTTIDVDTTYETTVDASFKISGIEYSIVKYDSEGQGILTANIRGTVAGLDGSYEIELPYEKAVKLKEGDTFAISYQTIRLGGNIVIVNIKY